MCAVDCDEEVEDGDGGTLSLCPFVGGPLGSWLDVISQSEGGGVEQKKGARVPSKKPRPFAAAAAAAAAVVVVVVVVVLV